MMLLSVMVDSGHGPLSADLGRQLLGWRRRAPSIPAVLNDLLVVADDAVLVHEASIIAAMKMLHDRAGLIVEPSAALGIAASKRPHQVRPQTCRHIVCGGNVDPDAYHRWIGAAPHRP